MAGGVEWARIRGKAGTEGGDWLSKVALSITGACDTSFFSFFLFPIELSTDPSQ
jgi:hypothetical protein